MARQERYLEIRERREVDKFFDELASEDYHPVFLDGSQALVSFLCNHRKLPVVPRFLRFDSQNDGNYLTASFSFEFSHLQKKQGSLFLRFVGRERVDYVWMMINDFPPEQNPVCTWVFSGYPNKAYLAELPDRYSEAPLVYEQTLAFAPWLRILLDQSVVSSDRKRQLLADYIQFAARYSPEMKHFRGIKATNQDQDEFMILGYTSAKSQQPISLDLSLQSSPPSYLRLVTTTGVMLAEIGGAYTMLPILPEMPKQKADQEYAIICVPAGRVFAHLETEWRVVARTPYLLITTEPMTLSQFLASEKNVTGLRQIFATMFYYPSDPDSL